MKLQESSGVSFSLSFLLQILGAIAVGVWGFSQLDARISELAQAANMSPRNFSRVFARDTGITPAQFVEGARVDAARALLENPALALKTVAYECGFRDAHHLRSVFMRRLGVSPQQFRTNFAVMA